MDSRRLVVWISAGILGFQGGTLALDLINCTVLSWLWVNRNGLAPAAPPASQRTGSSPVDPMGVFCERPRGRIDAAVGQGLTILAGLALGGSAGSGSRGDQP